MQSQSDQQLHQRKETLSLSNTFEVLYPRLCHYIGERYGFGVTEKENGILPGKISFTGISVELDPRIASTNRTHLTLMFFGLAVVLAHIPDAEAREAWSRQYFSANIPRYEPEAMQYAAQVLSELGSEQNIY